MTLLWVQLAVPLVTLLAAGFATWSSVRATRAQSDVQHRTVSLTEMEKALEFTGIQLVDLRKLVTNQQAEMNAQASSIRTLQDQHQECEREKLRLAREVAELRNGGNK